MAIADVIVEIDNEVERLNQARRLLVGGAELSKKHKQKRVMSAAGRRKIWELYT